MKVFFRNIHLYLSLGAGLVIMVVCATGAILVFEKEMQMWLYPERYRVESGSQAVSIEQMIAGLKKKVPDAEVNSIKIFTDPSRTVEVSYREEKSEGEHQIAKDAPAGNKAEKKGEVPDVKKGPEKGKEGGGQAFINPYTAQVAALQSQRSPFFFSVFSLHRWLLAGDTGKLIVGISTSVFLFILITGIILWWPQNKKILQQRLALKWNAGWKRLNHDLHIVIGFYSAIFLFAFAFTGLAWSFKWFNDGIYWVTGTENVRPEPPKSTIQEGTTPISWDAAYAQVKAQMPEAEFYTINFPKETDGSVAVTIMPADAIHERATNQLFFDQYSGQLISQLLYGERNLGQRVRATFYPVHVGSIGGLPGRIIAFLVCIAGATFPITGVVLWLNRLQKNRKKSKKKPNPTQPQAATQRIA
ncbi:PepSY domain-containing protein [Rhodocytophaga rosea]|uniref:PepSY domain-containing protein n=1 Tax=Rhodocytophaga rosea TaxID=2704465 RepID=A0A6C0GD30_9BACT|nr:PepSY-associated TM helix domain-containing protein [Rhodocytophaga rosea]QHT65600.1 PepSY domain-containing protein [Rhodocytophaga rosea]